MSTNFMIMKVLLDSIQVEGEFGMRSQSILRLE